ncbi:MAG: hypothetical protein AABY54_04970 [Deltaproteobacteria bacterium]
MKLYAASDLHSSNNYLAIIDENGEKRFKRKLPNMPMTNTMPSGSQRCSA